MSKVTAALCHSEAVQGVSFMSERWLLRRSGLLVVVFLCSQARAVDAQDAGNQSDRAKAALLAAVRPFTAEERAKRNLPALEYCSEGHVSDAGDVVHKGQPASCLDCTTFASAILHRMQNADYSKFDASVTGMWGDDIAAKYSLGKPSVATSISAFLDTSDRKELAEGVYFFDIRDGKAAQDKRDDRTGGAGHIGFLIVEGTGEKQRLTQVHMSGLKAVTKKDSGGLVHGSGFADFLRASRYGKDKRTRDSSRLWLYELRL